MKPTYKIGIWGQYGDGGKIADGQAVRTTIMTQELTNRYGRDNIFVVNTNNWKKRVVKFFFESIKMIAKSENVLVLPADNGFKVFVPLLQFVNILYNRNLYYIVIGGFLPKLLEVKPAYRKLVNNFKAIFVQTENLKKDLEMLEINSIHILSNPKRLNRLKLEELRVHEEKKVKLCVFSRISKDKGIEDAINAVKIVNEKLKGKYVTIDFYGLILEGYKDRFEELLYENSEFISYGGIVDYDKTVEALRDYFVLLFPTYYHGEGFPGNVIDAYNSGLPIIATDWLYNKDVIVDGRNGILVTPKSPQEIADAILKLYFDREYAYEIAKNNLKDAEIYNPDKIMQVLYQFLDV